MRKPFYIFFCLILALNSVVSNAVSGHNLRMLNVQNQNNVLVICTGTGTKWINSDVYFASGQIVEIQPPIDIDESRLNLACVASLAIDHKPFTTDNIPPVFTIIVTSGDAITSVVTRRVNSTSFLRPSSRAPPQFYFS